MDHNQNQNQDPVFQFIQSTFRQGTADGEDDSAQSRGGQSETSQVSQNASDGHAQTHADMQLDADYDDMPPLRELSHSGESDAESESDRDADEVEMQAVDRNDRDADASSTSSRPQRSFVYRSFPAQPMRQNSNRRPRVDDDDDEERDRRHPSQRVSSVNSRAASSSSSQASSPASFPRTHPSIPISGASNTPHPPTRQPPNVQRHVFHTTINLGPGGNPNPFRLFQHLFPNNNPNEPNPTNNGNNDNSNLNASGNDNNTPPGPPPVQPPQPPNGNNGPRPPPSIFGVSFDLGPGGMLLGVPAGAAMNGFPGGNPAANAQQAQALPPHLAELLSRIGAQFVSGLGMDNQEDPDRARKLIEGLEVVPEGLVRRLERVGGTGGGMGEDSTKGGDSGCAICWDRLLDSEGEGFGPSETADPKEGSSSTEVKQRKIVSLPCAHVFHAECLIPWFSRPRQTTCPTCRFNIDPDNLTYVSWSGRQRERREAEAAARTTEGAQPAPMDNVEASTTPNLDELLNAEAPPAPPIPGIVPNPINNDGRSEASEQIFRQLAALYAGGYTSGGNTRATQQANQQEQPDAQGGHQAPPAPPIPDVVPNPINNDARSEASEQIYRQLAALYAGGYTSGGNARATPQANQQEQPDAQAGQPQQPQPPHLRHGPAITVTSIPITIPIPVAIPFGGIHTGANPNAEPSTSTTPGNPPASTSGATNVNPPSTAIPAPPGGPSANVPLTPDDPNRIRLNSPWPFGVGLGLGPIGIPNMNPPPATPGTGSQPPQANTFNLEGLDFGIPGMRADVVVTMDMFFDPFGPGGPLRHDDQTAGVDHDHAADPAADHHHHHPEREAGELEMEEDVMMLMPEDDGQEQESEHFQRFLEMFAGPEGNPGNANRNRQGQPQQGQPQQTQLPPGLGNGVHVIEATRNMGETFARLLAGLGGRPPQDQQGQAGEQDAQPRPEEGGAPTEPTQPQAGDAPAPNAQPQPRIRRPFTMPPIFGPFGQFSDIFGPGGPGGRRARPEGPKPAWTLPPAPGPTLRQRVERREREAGLRCYDISCGLGPSDEDPFTDEMSKTVSGLKQLVIRQKDAGDAQVCEHRFHSACLVSAERVALSGANAAVEDGRVDVSCPVCRNAGCVTKEEWNEGVVALE